MSFILASASPRRKELLTQIYNGPVSICPADIDEDSVISENVEDYPLNIALAKLARAIQDHPNDTVLTADTMVYFQEQRLGKPHTEKQAFDMLKELQNAVHYVITGYALHYKGNVYSGKSITTLKIFAMTDEEIKSYIATKSPFDKAGGYGIQDSMIKSEIIKGSYYNVMGLPIEDLKTLLTKLKIIRP